MATLERRSRSRTRSQVSGFRIRDEDNQTAKNVVNSSTLPPRANRSLSRLSMQLRCPEAYAPTPLRHSSAGPEQVQRTNSARATNRDRRNIPMVHERDDNQHQRPPIKRWNSIQYLQKDEEPKAAVNIYDPNSISPLTVLKDQYDTRRPLSNHTGTADPDNHYRDLEAKTTTTTITPTTPVPAMSSKMYNKMVRAFHAALGSRPESKTALAQYQSEADDESDDEQHQTALEPFAPTLNDTAVQDLDTIISEINEFHSSFVQKGAQALPDPGFSRVQQKILDYKDLMTQEELSRNASHFLLSQKASKALQNDYAIKVQYETITHQYSQVRLRYPGPSVAEHYTTASRPLKATKMPLRSNVGVLGFLNRATLALQNTSKPWYAEQSNYTRIDAQMYIEELWQQEIDALAQDFSEKSALSHTSRLPSASSVSALAQPTHASSQVSD